MSITWALLADRSHAAVYENRGPGHGLELVERIEHEVGHLRDREMKSDKHGRAFDSGGEGRHTLERREGPHQHEARLFAKQLAERMRAARVAGRFDRLVLAADPAFLGLLRDAIDAPTRKIVAAEIPKHLLGAGDGPIEEHLAEALPIRPAPRVPLYVRGG